MFYQPHIHTADTPSSSAHPGLAAWGVMNQLLQGCPEPSTFTHVTGCVTRPLKLANTQWPTSGPEVPLLDLVSGIDLTKRSPDAFADALKK
jgi:hypothetical protein